MGSRIERKLEKHPGIYVLANGAYRVKVSVGDRKRGGQTREKTFPPGTKVSTMTGWQTDQRAELRRMKLVPAKGTLEADIPKYIDKLNRNKPEQAKNRAYELAAWVERFGARGRHTITRQDVRKQVNDWESAGVAASTIRHRLTALSKLYESVDGEDAENPVKGVKRPAEPDANPDPRPIPMIDAVLDSLWLRAAANNRGWKTLARALVLTHTGMRPSQLMRLDPDIDIRPYLDEPAPFVQVRRAGKKGKAQRKPLTEQARSAFLLLLRVGAVGKFSTSSFYKSWMLACCQRSPETA